MALITEIRIENLGNLANFHCTNVGNVNLIIGGNGTGKTFLLKSLYTAVKTMESYRRGDDDTAANEILAKKLRWTFQAEKLGDLVTKGAASPYAFMIRMGEEGLAYNFSKDASSKIVTFVGNFEPRKSNSIFLPAKEVLSLYHLILESRDIDQKFGFDDTYYDLAKVLRVAPRRGKNYTEFANARQKLKDIIGGRVDYDENAGKWYYYEGRSKFSIHNASEGIKKLAILDRLLANSYLGKDSIIFIDEPESALHPRAISDFLDMLFSISKNMGIQIFIASHSYFVIEKLCLLAQKNQASIPCISLEKDGCTISNLSKGMPSNSIIDESIRLYEEEVDMVL
ncbi:MAG: ATP-binding protein [Oscillospiraceae bacterium]|nr:ATP-binding protein [Oscillospiraceae bacterium]